MSRGKGLLALLLLLSLIPLIGLALLWDYTLHGRNPQYVLEHVTPPYEEEAEQFFYDNKSNLLKLAQLVEENDDLDYCSYALNMDHQYDRGDIPDDILAILQEIEEATTAHYSISLWPESDMILVRITSQTDFDVDLYSSREKWDISIREGRSKRIELEDGWVIDTHHVLRG